jgi:hypothetical protein
VYKKLARKLLPHLLNFSLMSKPITAQQPRRDSRGRALERIPSPAPLWQKGQSGNPSGKSGFYHEAMKLARHLTPAAVRRLGELAGRYPGPDGEWIPLEKLEVDPRVVSVAAMALVERTLGRPKEYDPISGRTPLLPD